MLGSPKVSNILIILKYCLLLCKYHIDSAMQQEKMYCSPSLL